jgi:D-alanyl-D-alanine carboxypeptidase
MLQKPKDTLQLIVHESDIPHDGKGMLIPQSFTPTAIMETPKKETRMLQTVTRVAVAGAAAFLFLLAGTVGVGMVSQMGQVASPVVTVIDPYTLETTTLTNGPQIALSQPNFYIETRDAFIDDAMTFIEIDLTREQVRYFENGVLVQSAEIVRSAEPGSWWETPSGMYEVVRQDESFFSSLAQVNLPWTIAFEENFIIHGAPTYPDGSSVKEDFIGGGVWLENDAAKQLFAVAKTGTPVLVHTAKPAPDSFVYEPPVPDVDIPHYFIADIENDTVLAASDLDEKAAIASITKLMTAVVATEELQLDKRVFVTSPNFVTSLVPRLANRSSVSMYSLMQLLLVESSNEAAEVLAAELGRAEFIDAMNQKARQLGMLDTTFADPSGLSSDNVSTVGDLYRLTQYIYENRRFILDITKDVDLPTSYSGGDFAGLTNFNEIEDTPGFVGGKVGETNAAGQTSVSLHELSIKGTTRTVVVIVLGSEGRTADVQTLVSFVEEQFGE